MSGFDDYLKSAPVTQSPPSFDAYLNAAPTSPATAPAAPPQSRDSSLWGDLSRQVGLTVRAGVNGLTGIPAMVGDALNAGLNMIPGVHLAPVSSSINDLENKAGLPQPQNDAERFSQSVAGSMAGASPAIGAGSALSKMVSPTAQAIGSALRSMPGMQVVGAAGAGAGSDLSRQAGFGPVGQTAGALVGGLAGAVAPSMALAGARAVRNAPEAVVSAVQPFTNPGKYVGRQLAEKLGPDAALVAQNIKGAPEYVPGSLPTTAQVGATPTLVATEKSLANISPEFKIALAEREAQNNAARWQSLSGVAQTPEALAQAQAAREAAAGPLYDAAHANTANVGRSFIDFARRPAVQQAMQAADQMARNEGVRIKWPTPQDRSIDGKALDYTTRALGDMIDSAKRAGNNQQARALTEAQAYLKSWTEQYVPGVREAAQVYAQHSTPINTMEAGQQIMDALGNKAMNAQGVPQIPLTAYRSALTRALKSQPYGVEENAANALQGIGQDLQRSTISSGLRSPGSDTAYNISANGWLARQLYGSDFKGASIGARAIGAMGAFLSGHPMVGGAILGGGDKIGGIAAKRLNAALGEMMLNPETMLPYLESASKSSKNINPLLLKTLRSNVNQGLVGSSVSQGSKK